tara:strand:- start:96 stop:494 length:399 start_codon:yes stop_codon:yes gene_type:complete
MKKDYNYIAKLEAAIKEKYGQESIQNPKSLWNQEKEKKYLSDLKAFYARKRASEKEEKERIGDVLISKKILNKQSNRECPVCKSYSFETKDDLYMNKFECCYVCYIKYVEGREKRWCQGWRPDQENTMVIME